MVVVVLVLVVVVVLGADEDPLDSVVNSLGFPLTDPMHSNELMLSPSPHNW